MINKDALLKIVREHKAKTIENENEFLYVKTAIDSRKNFYQKLEHLEKEYDRIKSELWKLMDSEYIQRYNELLYLCDDSLKGCIDNFDTLETVLLEIRELLNMDDVIKYVELSNRIEIVESELFKLRGEVINKFDKRYFCPHPLYAADGKKARCILCRKKYKVAHGDLKQLEDMIKAKRLIADIDYHISNKDVYYILKEIAPIEEIEAYYRKAYSEVKDIDEIKDDYSAEDYVWDHFCLERKPKIHKPLSRGF